MVTRVLSDTLVTRRTRRGHTPIRHGCLRSHGKAVGPLHSSVGQRPLTGGFVMSSKLFRPRWRRSRLALAVALPLLGAGVYAGAGMVASAQADGSWGRSPGLRPGNLLVFTSTYQQADLTPGSTVLPPGCTAASAAASGTPCGTAGYGGTTRRPSTMTRTTAASGSPRRSSSTSSIPTAGICSTRSRSRPATS